ncbi:MAG: SLC13 family permease [Prevotellaceae bacterium]|nr:SLC13 family permease [Prevotellaceae bacterium]
MIITFAVLALTAFFFVWGKIRADVVALCALLLLVLCNVLTTREALTGFSNEIVIMMIALFVVGGGIFQTGLAQMISTRIVSLAGKSELKLFILVMLATASMGAFVSNTGTVALMLPIVVSLAVSAGTNVRRLLMPMAFASSLGAMFTLIGTPPNMIVSDTLKNSGIAGFENGLSFFSFFPIGVIAVGFGIVSLWFMSKLLVKGDKNEEGDKDISSRSVNQLMQSYQIAENLYRVKVTENSPVNNKSLKELSISQRFNVSILEIRRNTRKNFLKTENQDIAGPESIIAVNDILYVLGSLENVNDFVKENKLLFLSKSQSENKNDDTGKIGVAELVLMAKSQLINKQIKETDFRSVYNVNVLGIQRHNEYILKNIREEKIHVGDVLLIQGKWEDIQNLARSSTSWVMLGQPMEEANKVLLSSKAPLAAIILILMVAAMVFEWLPPVMASMVAAVLMVLTGCLRNVESAYKTINWESIVLFAGMIPMAIAMENTGASRWIAESIVGQLGTFGPVAVMAGIYLATSCVTLFISNTATAVLFAPIALQTALTLNVSPLPFMFTVAVAASMCFASPFATPPNALVMSAGRYSFMDYVKVGLPMQLIYALIMILVLPLLFPF